MIGVFCRVNHPAGWGGFPRMWGGEAVPTGAHGCVGDNRFYGIFTTAEVMAAAPREQERAHNETGEGSGG